MGRVLGQSKIGPITEYESPIPVFGTAPTSPTYKVMEGVFGGMGEPREVTKPYNEYIEIPKLGQYTYTPLQEKTREELSKAWQTPTAPTFNYTAPAYERSKEIGYTQEAASPMLGKLVNAFRGTLVGNRSQFADSPYLYNQATQSGLKGMGEGIASIMDSARKQGIAQYAPEYAAATDASRANWEADARSKLAQYANEIDKSKALFGMTGGAEDEMKKMLFEASLKEYLANT